MWTVFRNKNGRFGKRDGRKKQSIEVYKDHKRVKIGDTKNWTEEEAEKAEKDLIAEIVKYVAELTLQDITENHNLNIKGVEKASKEFEIEAPGKETTFIKVTLRMEKSYKEEFIEDKQGKTKILRKGWIDGKKEFTARIKKDELSTLEAEILEELTK
jgi:hypothetical protein